MKVGVKVCRFYLRLPTTSLFSWTSAFQLTQKSALPDLARQLQSVEARATGLQLCGEGEFMSYNLVAKDWRELSEAASKELDPQKLMELVTQLNEVLKQREDRKRDTSNFEPPQQ
jgi:hypothetical protein